MAGTGESAGFFDWLRTLFGGSGQAAVSTGRPKSATGRRGATSPVSSAGSPGSGASEAPPRGDQEFDFFALAEFDAAAREALTGEAQESVNEMASLLLAEFENDTDSLPAFPSLAGRINELLSKDSADLNELIKIISHDPTAASQILKVSNSSFYRRGDAIENIRDAVVRLGVNEVGRIATAASMHNLFAPGEPSAPELVDVGTALWLGAMTVAQSAAWLALERQARISDRVFMAGMLHDIGKALALRPLPFLLLKDDTVEYSDQFLWMVLESVHIDIARIIVEKWELPTHLALCCTEHHAVAVPDSPDHSEIHLVRVVSGMNEMRVNPWHRANLASEIRQSANTLELDFFQLRALSTQIKEAAEREMSLARG